MSDPNWNLRVNMHAEYFEICREQVRAYERYEQQIQDLDHSNDEQHIIDMNKAESAERKAKAALIAIPFSAMCLEAFIYDYGASKLTDSFFRKYLDKLALTPKWVLTVKLATGSDFPRDCQAFQRIRELEKDRNRIVHFKSMGASIHEIEKLSEFATRHRELLPEAMYNGYQAVIDAMGVLDELDPGHRFQESFLTEAKCHA